MEEDLKSNGEYVIDLSTIDANAYKLRSGLYLIRFTADNVNQLIKVNFTE